MTLRPLTSLLLLSLLGACSSSSSSPGASSPPGTDGGGGDDGGTSSGTSLPPPAAGHGIQLTMETTIAASTEDERCKFVQTTEDLWVNSEQIRYTPGSHHFLLYHTPYTSIPTADKNGNPVDTSGVFDCPDGGPAAYFNVDRGLGGAQSPDAPSVIGGLPSDVAVHIPSGSVLALDLHVLNASMKPLDVTVVMNLNTIPQSQAKVEAGVYFFYNPFIRVPAGAKSQARMSCPVTSDVTIVNGQTHMHKQGLGGVANLEDSSGNVMQQLYASQTWVDPPVKVWSPGMTMSAGQQIDFLCNYQNAGTTDVIQGLSAAKNEMCVYAGAYYPRDTTFENCTGATYIGTGAASGATTLQCMGAVSPSDPNFDDNYFGCVVNSCPKIAKPLTAFINCELQNGSSSQTACATQYESVQTAACQ
ncbi:MAG TPA: hypothetical protein VF765_02305 [Polyangiaceae bacterium]